MSTGQSPTYCVQSHPLVDLIEVDTVAPVDLLPQQLGHGPGQQGVSVQQGLGLVLDGALHDPGHLLHLGGGEGGGEGAPGPLPVPALHVDEVGDVVRPVQHRSVNEGLGVFDEDFLEEENRWRREDQEET